MINHVIEGHQGPLTPVTTEQTSSPTMTIQPERPSIITNDTIRGAAPNPTPSSINTYQTRPLQDESEDSSEEYHSFSSESEAEDRDNNSEHLHTLGDPGEAEDRELERQRVMEAAGLVVRKHEGPTPPPRPRARKRRPAPLAPNRATKTQSRAHSEKDLPETPMTPEESVLRLEDAYDRYEAFKTHKSQNQGHRHRYSIISSSSVDSMTTPSSPKSANMSLAPTMSSITSVGVGTSGGADGKHSSGFLHTFFGRASGSGGGHDRRSLTVSAPMMMPSSPLPSAFTPTDSITRENSPAFGMSWSSLVDKDVLRGIPPAERKRQEVRL